MNREMYESTRRLREAEGGMAFHLDVFGDHVAKREGYKATSGREALWLYVIQKHHWLPRDVRSMTDEDFRLVLGEEMHGWTLPAEAR
jgi:hypothetical protein